MTRQEAEVAIQGRFNTVWADRTVIAWPNVAFTPPTPDPAAPSTGWVRFTILHAEAFAAGAGASGNRLHRYPGTVIIQVFTASGGGVGAGNALAMVAEGAFNLWESIAAAGSLHFGVPTIRHVGESNGWCQHNVECPFRHDRTGV